MTKARERHDARERQTLQAWLTLRAVDGLSETALFRLVQTFGSPWAVLTATAVELTGAGCSAALAQAIQRGPDARARERIDQELDTIDRLKLSVVTCLDEDYPARLRMIPDPPPVLYVAGRLEPSDQYAVAIVGARRASQAGRVLAEELSRDLAASGFTIVSGLARGIDAAAHRGALAAGGRTVAVLGCGVDRTYPPEHDKLRGQIEAHGAVLSELPLGSPPHSYHFPRRNRIISGLCLGVVVAEAAIESGSLITARLAADQGREVFAVPGFAKAANSRGPNGLIKQGAKLVECAQDVVDELLPQLDDAFRRRVKARASDAREPLSPLSGDEAKVYDALSYEPQHMDDVVVKTGLSPSEVAALLLALELKRRVRQLPGHSYLRL